MDAPTSFDFTRWDEPAAPPSYKHEDELDATWIKILHESGPALVSPGGSQLDRVVTRCGTGTARGLHLDSREPTTEIGDQVVVRAVKEGEGDDRPDRGEPLDGGRLAEIALTPRVKSFGHPAEHTFA